MGTLNSGRIILLIALLLVTAFVVYVPLSDDRPLKVKAPLREAFADIKGWNATGNALLDENVERALELDDYLFSGYERGDKIVSLYIGYYRSAAKIGAAHDPLVCFSGQGWRTGGHVRGKYALRALPGLQIAYSSMLAENAGERALILYWFQTNGRTSSNSFSQKIDMISDRIFKRGEDNAFVRITTPLGNEVPEVARKRIFDFIDTFYPAFHSYMTRSNINTL